VDLRLTAFLNRESVRTDPDNKRRSAERLIDQEIIRQEIISGGFRRPAEDQAAGLEGQPHARSLLGGSEARLRAELARYGLNEKRSPRNSCCGSLRFSLSSINVFQARRGGYRRGGPPLTNDQHLADLQPPKIHKPAATRLWRPRSGDFWKASA